MEELTVLIDGNGRRALRWRLRTVQVQGGNLKNLVRALLKIYRSYGKIREKVRIIEYKLAPEEFERTTRGVITIDNTLISMVGYLNEKTNNF